MVCERHVEIEQKIIHRSKHQLYIWFCSAFALEVKFLEAHGIFNTENGFYYIYIYRELCVFIMIKKDEKKQKKKKKNSIQITPQSKMCYQDMKKVEKQKHQYTECKH